MTNTDYFERAQELARRAGMPLTQLCIAAGLSRGTAFGWREGGATPNIKSWEKLEAAAKQLGKRKTKSTRANAT